MDPDDPIEAAVTELEAFLDDVVDDLGGGAAGHVPVDVRDAGEEYVVTADLPGYDREDLTVELSEGGLHIGAETETATDEDHTTPEGRYIRNERRRSSVSRTVGLPDPVEEAAVEASYSRGVLTVTLPKTDADATTIEVE